MTINLDFDGTVVSHEYPLIGKDIGSVPVLKRMLENDCKFILFTMRSGDGLMAAVKWFEDNNIPLFGINKNPTQGVWTSSPKSYAELMIDDSALGIPLIFDKDISRRPFVDWKAVEELLVARDIIKKAII